MRSKFSLVSVTALLFVTTISIFSCAEKNAAPKSATIEELGQMNRDFAKALVAGDAAAAANLYAEDASILPPNEPMVTGRANIQKYWQVGIDAGIVGATVHTTAAASDGDLGYEIGTFEMQIKDTAGNIIIDKGKYTELLKRNAEGKWISIYGMWSSDTAPEPVAEK